MLLLVYMHSFNRTTAVPDVLSRVQHYPHEIYASSRGVLVVPINVPHLFAVPKHIASSLSPCLYYRVNIMKVDSVGLTFECSCKHVLPYRNATHCRIHYFLL